MPKWSEHPRKAESRAREEARKKDDHDRKEHNTEDVKWRETDEKVLYAHLIRGHKGGRVGGGVTQYLVNPIEPPGVAF